MVGGFGLSDKALRVGLERFGGLGRFEGVEGLEGVECKGHRGGISPLFSI